MDFANFWFSSGAGGGGGYQIDNSLRFRGPLAFTDPSSASPQRLTRTFGTPTNRQVWTFSTWIKTTGIAAAGGGGGTPGYYHCLIQGGDFAGALYSNVSLYAVWAGDTQAKAGSGAMRDPGAWYNIVFAFNGSNCTIYRNGVSLGTGGSAGTSSFNTARAHTLFGVASGVSGQRTGFDGYAAETHFVDGQALAATDFGEFNDDGVWVPIDVTGLTYGNNGFFLDFSDPSNIGADRSGNGNNFTPTGFELTNTTSTLYDWMEDSPTNNFSTLNPILGPNAININNANLQLVFANAGGSYAIPATIGADSGSFYAEYTWQAVASGSSCGVGIVDLDELTPTTEYGVTGVSRVFYDQRGRIRKDGTDIATGLDTCLTPGDVTGVAVDCTNGSVSFYKNGTLLHTETGLAYGTYGFFYIPNVGGSNNTNTVAFNTGNRPFIHTPPAGFEPLSTAELPAVAITNPSDHFQTILGPGPGTGSTTPIAIQYKTTASADSPSATYQDEVYGKPATDLGGADGVHPMFEWASRLVLEGHDDWYIPARYEIEIIYRNLKPTTTANSTSYGANPNAVPPTSNYTASVPAQTTVTAFQSGGSEAFTATDYYWTATEGSVNTNCAWMHGFDTGYQRNSDIFKNTTRYARAIRRVAFTGSEPAIGAAYEGGYFGGLIDAKATPDGTATHALIVASKEGGEYGVATGILDVAQRTFPNGLWWIKDRANANNHQLVDSARGGNLALQSNTTAVDGAYSAPAGNSVAWCWNAPDAFTSNAGTIASSGRRNVDAGFSIVSYTGNGVNGATWDHGLGVPPDLVIVKNRDGELNWAVYHSGVDATAPEDYWLLLDDTNARVPNTTIWGSTAPTSTTVKVGWLNETNANNNTYIAYCWAEVEGYSKFGLMTPNYNANGPFVYCGFKPAFLLFKNAERNGTDWVLIDTARDSYNYAGKALRPSQANSEDAYAERLDILSNGFKIRTTDLNYNGPDTSPGIIYAAFAEHPFGGSNVSPSPAR